MSATNHWNILVPSHVTVPPESAFLRGLFVLRVWLERARQRRALSELSEHHLADIGLEPYEARTECNKWPWQP